jgi:hypothetical protein
MAAKKKKLVRRLWTKADVRNLKTMAKAKAGITKISKNIETNKGRDFGQGSHASCKSRYAGLILHTKTR